MRWEGYEEPEWERERDRQLETDGCHEVIHSFWERKGVGCHRARRCMQIHVGSTDVKSAQDASRDSKTLKHTGPA